jgi:hypothetical protein
LPSESNDPAPNFPTVNAIAPNAPSGAAHITMATTLAFAASTAKVVIVAVMRKMLTILDAMVRDDLAWSDASDGPTDRTRSAGRRPPGLVRSLLLAALS